MDTRRYRKKNSDVESVIFDGWDSFAPIFEWSKGRCYFVPEGHQHPLRYDNESIGPEKITVNIARAFVVVVNSGGEYRADQGDVIFKSEEGEFFANTKEQFAADYQPIL